MKYKLFLSTIYFICIVLISGCQQNDISKITNPIEISEDTVSFAGVWSGQGSDWVIHIGVDGNIPEVHRAGGLHMDLSVEGIKNESPDKQLFVQYIYGDCFWSYNTETNNLKATVTLDNYYMDIGGIEVSYAMVDEFEGPVSSDKMTWTANWKTITTFDTNTSDQVSTGRKIIFVKLP